MTGRRSTRRTAPIAPAQPAAPGLPPGGKLRHLTRTSTPNRRFVILAIDHRGNLRQSLEADRGVPVPDSALTRFKADVIGALLPEVSAVLTDPDFGYTPFLSAPGSGQCGLLMPLEVTDYSVHPSRRTTDLIPNWSVEKAKSAGADGIKLLLYYHPEAHSAANQRLLVAQVIEQCRRFDIPFFLEPIVVSPDPARPLAPDARRQIVIDNARTFSQMGIDVLKSEFPVDVAADPDREHWRAALRELNAACRVPWALLSGGVDYPVFREQVELACEAGAGGVIVGRAVWAEATALSDDARMVFLTGTARARIADLRAICSSQGAAWDSRLQLPRPDSDPPGATWYR